MLTFRLEPSLVNKIDEQADKLGVSRTVFVENCLFNSVVGNGKTPKEPMNSLVRI